jgi:hypothetical protein
MKVSTRKRLEALEQAAWTRAARPIVIVEVMQMSAADRQAYRAGDQQVLRRYGSPDAAEVPLGQIHTIIIDLHPACRRHRMETWGLQDSHDFGD